MAKSNTLPAQPESLPLRYFRTREHRRVPQPIGDEPSMTRQEFKNDCDINRILAKFQTTGAMNHFAKFAPQYGDFSPCDLQEAHNLLLRARAMFDALPSAVRKEVATPEGFLAFVQDPKNADRMAELGLTNKKQGQGGAAPKKEGETPPQT